MFVYSAKDRYLAGRYLDRLSRIETLKPREVKNLTYII